MITSLQNPLVKQIRQLHQGKGRRQAGQLLLEGTHLIETALHQGKAFHTVCMTSHWQEKYPTLAAQLLPHSEQIILVGPPVLEKLATTVNPDGIVATVPSKNFWRSPTLPCDLALGLETLQDPGNLGTILRTAAAVGVEGIWLSDDCADIDSPKVLRAAAGNSLLIPQTRTPDLTAIAHQCQAQGMQIVATLPNAKQTLWEVDLRPPTLFLFGSEGQGLSPSLRHLATVSLTIPQRPPVESLNVAIAVGVVLYEVQRQRQSLNYH